MYIINSSTLGLLKAFRTRLQDDERFKQKSSSTQLKIVCALNIFIEDKKSGKKVIEEKKLKDSYYLLKQ